jgi:ATP-dependent Lon protease
MTGQLGNVMRERAQAALTLMKTRSSELGVGLGVLEGSDIHIHVPAGATPKDGPSAGVAMFTALASLVTGRNVRSDTAVTGEISLRGLVLPVGGIKEKVVAAAAVGLTRVMLPARNRRDYDDIPAGAREKLESCGSSASTMRSLRRWRRVGPRPDHQHAARRRLTTPRRLRWQRWRRGDSTPDTRAS